MTKSKSNATALKIQGVNENNYSIMEGNRIIYVTEQRNRDIICELNHLTGCHEVTSNKPRNDGYIMCAKTINGKVIAGYAHRVVYEAMKGDILNATEIMHLCDNKKCCNIEHIILGSHKENMRDLNNKGIANHTKGHERSNKVLTVSDVIFVKNNLDKYTDAEFAKMFGLLYQTFYYIRNRKQWAHVSKDDDPSDPKFANERKQLTLSDVETICSYKFTIPQLAEIYKCSGDFISRIRRGDYPRYLQKEIMK